MTLTLAAGLFAAASAVALAQAPAGAAGAENSEAQQRRQNPAPSPSEEQTITGCLTSADNVYTLTVLNDSGARGTTAETIAYTLAPGSGVDLRPHLNKRVTVKGTEAGPDAQTSNRVVFNTPAAPAATGTSGAAAPSGADTTTRSTGTAGSNPAPNTRSARSGNAPAGAPRVDTTAKARITTKAFNVTNVQLASGNCGA